MGRYTTVEVDIDIEDYIDDLGLDVLLEEAISRLPKTKREKQKQKELVTELFDCLEKSEIFDLLFGRMTITEADKIKSFLESEMNINWW